MKILYHRGEYDRLNVYIKEYANKYVVYSSSEEMSSDKFDKGQQYEPIVLKDLVPATLK